MTASPGSPGSGAITVKLHGHLPWYRAERCSEVTLPLAPAVTLEEVVRLAGVPLEEISIVLVNGSRCELDYAPSAGDAVDLFPIISGG